MVVENKAPKRLVGSGNIAKFGREEELVGVGDYILPYHPVEGD